MNRLEQELRARFGARLRTGAPLAELTSFRIGGPADVLLAVESEDELRAAMAAAWCARVPAFCLGAGTNLLVSDRGVRGLVIHLGEGFTRLEFDDVKVRAGAAAQFGALVEDAVDRGLKGLEFGEGIPGSVGGGLVMNAGAFGGEIARVVRLVHGVGEQGQSIALTGAEVKFSYRRTELPPRFVITQVDFELEPGDREQ
ncbi:MAG: FAD-binding protein, partial [Candidatus Binataceae bacterium]